MQIQITELDIHSLYILCSVNDKLNSINLTVVHKSTKLNLHATGLEKVSFHSNPNERQCQRMLNYRTIALISYASKVMLKILQARLQQYVNHELPDVQAGFRNGKGTRDQIANILWIMEKVPEKHLFLLY